MSLSSVRSQLSVFCPSAELRRKLFTAVAFSVGGLVACGSGVVLLAASLDPAPRGAYAPAPVEAQARQAVLPAVAQPVPAQPAPVQAAPSKPALAPLAAPAQPVAAIEPVAPVRSTPVQKPAEERPPAAKVMKADGVRPCQGGAQTEPNCESVATRKPAAVNAETPPAAPIPAAQSNPAPAPAPAVLVASKPAAQESVHPLKAAPAPKENAAALKQSDAEPEAAPPAKPRKKARPHNNPRRLSHDAPYRGGYNTGGYSGSNTGGYVRQSRWRFPFTW